MSPALDPAAGHPDREPLGVVVAAVGVLPVTACDRTLRPRSRASCREGPGHEGLSGGRRSARSTAGRALREWPALRPGCWSQSPCGRSTDRGPPDGPSWSRGLLKDDAGGLGRRVRPHAARPEADGRDHNNGLSVWLAGGGVKAGSFTGHR